MSLKNKISVGVIAAGLSFGVIHKLSNQTVETTNFTQVEVETILKQTEILDEMKKKGICETIEYVEKTTDGNVKVIGFRCDKKEGKSEYVITMSNFDKKYIINKDVTCQNVEINYGELSNKTNLLRGNRIVITGKGETKRIDDTTCSEMLGLKTM
ncbi:MAG: hypothetical protein PHH98_01205 [Candidatus Gracilibacteria bacterium]|nr:hypothetical protein [Candidatus Gracilibacteria bacterium]